MGGPSLRSSSSAPPGPCAKRRHPELLLSREFAMRKIRRRLFWKIFLFSSKINLFDAPSTVGRGGDGAVREIRDRRTFLTALYNIILLYAGNIRPRFYDSFVRIHYRCFLIIIIISNFRNLGCLNYITYGVTVYTRARITRDSPARPPPPHPSLISIALPAPPPTRI